MSLPKSKFQQYIAREKNKQSDQRFKIALSNKKLSTQLRDRLSMATNIQEQISRQLPQVEQNLRMNLEVSRTE